MVRMEGFKMALMQAFPSAKLIPRTALTATYPTASKAAYKTNSLYLKTIVTAGNHYPNAIVPLSAILQRRRDKSKLVEECRH
jgi:hypothetical protein